MATRRSQRLAVQKASSDENTSVQPSKPQAHKVVVKKLGAKKQPETTNQEPDNVKDALPPNQRRPKTKTPVAAAATTDSCPAPKRRGRKGILEQITDTPLDVLFEIFSYLEPFDLLRLSRTTKDLRGLLMSKSSAFYANLLFDGHCHNCGAMGAKHVQFEIRMRLCKACLDEGEIMMSWTAVHDALTDSVVARELVTMVPKYIFSTSSGGRTYYYDRASLVQTSKEYAAIKTQALRANFSREKNQEHALLARECEPHQAWLTSRKNNRTEELALLRRERLFSVVERLRADGWEEEVKSNLVLKTLGEHKLVNQPKPLTDRMWQNMESSVVEVMEQLRAELLAERIRTAVSRRIVLVKELCQPLIDKMPELPATPPVTMLPIFNEFAKLIAETPHEEELTADHFAAALDYLPTRCARWRHVEEGKMKALLLKAGRSDDLSLVANAFTCSSCTHFPSVLHHPYFASHRCFFGSSQVGSEQVKPVWYPKLAVAIDQFGQKVCNTIIKMSGLDPKSATASDMDSADVFFTCEECFKTQYAPPGNRHLRLMRWRAAMNHHRRHMNDLKRVTDEDVLVRARLNEETELASRMKSSYDRETSVCILCSTVQASPEARTEHLKDVHGITNDDANYFKLSQKSKSLLEKCVFVKERFVPTANVGTAE
ncbi:hypothetical protein CPB85DRAFT_1436555 [Mucidula mucida]|nr:hypothetical protein CPB85DRAFT_1436555 [Mucidula mucida]